ncbi:UvrD-helicase domain-containing protein [Priestia megaterium]|uniref:UvrD-helicase domain-containing protein n=1 Tax=Priestia megaterium TaxID=1404 RepID=UPI002079360D|nr:UvrD-helicase domain-containing protein [Priestia megaterium]USL27997.1 UvrD-helicase domain-containing protein [Priestia megaterium]
MEKSLESRSLEKNQIANLREIERSLLPINCKFSVQQKNVIFSERSANIVAGPGSGKTTVLIAKIAFILKQMEKQNSKGICIITHTNVAVEEIRNKLQDMGIENLQFPHFLGTIHDFFNHFFTYKAYREIYGKSEITIFDEEVYKERFKVMFENHRPENYSYNPPTSKIQDTYLEFDDKDSVTLIGECSDSYKSALINTFKSLLEIGVFRHNDCLSFSNWYINKYKNPIINAFENRFDWAFIDEAQDTSAMQYDLLMKVLGNSSIKLQKYGDPYQSLYTMFGNNKDAWVPSDEKVDKDELFYSTRFGNTIANVLQTTCIEEYTTLQGNSNRVSFKPHLLLYSSRNKVVEEYLKLINEFSQNNEEFRISKKKIGVVGLLHDQLKRYYPVYEKKSDAKVKSETIVSNFIQVLLKGFLFYIKRTNDLLKQEKVVYSFSYFNERLNSQESFKIKCLIATCIKNVYHDKGIINDSTKNQVTTIYEEMANLEGISLTQEDLLEESLRYVEKQFKINYLSYQRQETNLVIEENDIECVPIKQVNFGTVHAVKGETHKATLLVESEVERGFGKNRATFYDCTEIFDFLMGKYSDYNNKREPLRGVIRDALKTAYVALSRPTHLAVVAISKNNFGENLEEKQKQAREAGWVVINID